jgi:predicted O-linked N-acetylglucosamine transferase (SPINDLY family)
LILELSRDRAALARLRADVAAARETAPLFDLDGFVHRLEAGYEAAWQLWYRGKPTRDITVPSV